MTVRGPPWERMRRTVAYRLAYVLILSFGGVGFVVILFGGAVIGYYWAPSDSTGALAFLVLTIAIGLAFLGFLILLPPVRAESEG